jgi:hypothetical protein
VDLLIYKVVTSWDLLFDESKSVVLVDDNDNSLEKAYLFSGNKARQFCDTASQIQSYGGTLLVC